MFSWGSNLSPDPNGIIFLITTLPCFVKTFQPWEIHPWKHLIFLWRWPAPAEGPSSSTCFSMSWSALSNQFFQIRQENISNHLTSVVSRSATASALSKTHFFNVKNVNKRFYQLSNQLFEIKHPNIAPVSKLSKRGWKKQWVNQLCAKWPTLWSEGISSVPPQLTQMGQEKKE